MDRTHWEANIKVSTRIRDHSKRTPRPAETTTNGSSSVKCNTFIHQGRGEHKWSLILVDTLKLTSLRVQSMLRRIHPLLTGAGCVWLGIRGSDGKKLLSLAGMSGDMLWGEGYRDPTNGLWRFPLRHPAQNNKQANIMEPHLCRTKRRSKIGRASCSLLDQGAFGWAAEDLMVKAPWSSKSSMDPSQHGQDSLRS